VTGRPLVYHAVNLMRDELHTYRFIRPAWVANGVAGVLDWVTPRLADEIHRGDAGAGEGAGGIGGAGGRITMIPCGIQPEMFAGAKPEWVRERYGLAGRRVVMYTGVNSAFQRIDYLLRGYAVAREGAEDAVLDGGEPAGDEPDLASNQALARELGLEVIWAGPHTLGELAITWRARM